MKGVLRQMLDQKDVADHQLDTDVLNGSWWLITSYIQAMQGASACISCRHSCWLAWIPLLLPPLLRCRSSHQHLHHHQMVSSIYAYGVSAAVDYSQAAVHRCSNQNPHHHDLIF